MFSLNKPLKLPPQLIWKFAHEPELLGWTVKARNYNTLIANCFFVFMLLFIFGVSVLIYNMNDDLSPNWQLFWSALFYMIMGTVSYFATHQRMSFAYRFSESGLEFCEWRDLPGWMLPFLKWFSIFTALAFLIMATIDLSFLIGALAGPGGMGLMYLRLAHTKSYQDMYTEYHHHEYKWERIIQLAVATNREVVDVRYTLVYEGDDYESEWNLNIFCKKGQKEAVASFIRPYLSPDTPFVRDKVRVPLSTRRPD